MGADIVAVRNNFHEKSHFLQILDHGFSRLIAVHAEVFARDIDGRVIVHDADLFQVVAFSDLEVVRVVGRCDLYAAGSEFLVNILVGDHRDLAVCERKL